ncbi:MAG: bifunctional riboflavin kinase/FAD synthetase [Bacteroidales bacterium]
MIIHEGYKNLNFNLPVVTLGIFDGVHRGHRFLLDKLVSRAAETHGESVAITFNPHPRLVLEKNSSGLFFLSTFEEKKFLLGKTGIDHLIIIEFSREFSLMKACDFVREVLVSKVGTKHLIIGHDNHFGYRGEGNFETIRDCAGLYGMKVERVGGFQYEGETVSSSIIREELLNGNPSKANKLLGYCYSIKGIVAKGRGLGREIGFPTANIKLIDNHKLVPANGVYAVETMADKHKYKGMLSIGKNPTVNKKSAGRSVEVNIFDFDRDIYGEEIEIIFRFRLRDQQKFGNIGQLSQQLELDKVNALQLLS